MKKIITMILAVIIALSLSFGAIASETEVSLDDMAAQIRSFEEVHPELKDQFHLMILDVTGIATEEFRTAFSQIQGRFDEMLEVDRQKLNIPDADHETMREQLDTQASLMNAGFIAHLKAAEDQMIAALRGMEYTASETDVIAVLEKLIAENSDSDDAHISALIARLSRIVEKAKNEYNGDLNAWYKEITAVPELQPGDSGKVDDEPRPPVPEGEEGKGSPEADGQIKPFNDHFTVIQEELAGAFGRINERLQNLATEAPEKYQISDATAAEEFDLVHQLFILVNNQIMEQLGNMDRMTKDAMGTP